MARHEPDLAQGSEKHAKESQEEKERKRKRNGKEKGKDAEFCNHFSNSRLPRLLLRRAPCFLSDLQQNWRDIRLFSFSLTPKDLARVTSQLFSCDPSLIVDFDRIALPSSEVLNLALPLT